MIILQNIIFPELDICSEQELFVHGDALSALDTTTRTIELTTGGSIVFDTYFNALSLRKWHGDGQLEDLFVTLHGTGRLELRAYHALPERSWELVTSAIIDLDAVQTHICDLSSALSNPDQGLLYVQIKALTDSTLHDLSFATSTMPNSWPKLTVSITTFKREAEVETTVHRLTSFLETYAHADHIDILVVDNGQSADIMPSGKVRYLPNDNLGGAGGFARGLLEAEKSGATHVLFTDDDASFYMESLHRIYIFLALAKDSRTAIAGAMINNIHKWAMWENGAIFDRFCRPLGVGRDLRQMTNVFDLEIESSNMRHPNLYAGWWMFAFPVAHVTYHPYPFFVRGDDISFSLSNDFRITTLNGVVSFQDDFSEKESPLTLYLDVRNHINHHLSLPSMDIGWKGAMSIPIIFTLKSLVRFHYETAEACLLAWEDVMSGPDFFVANKDMSERRTTLKTIIKNERFQPLEVMVPEHMADPHQRLSRWRLLCCKFSLNGHLFPIRRNRPSEAAVAPQERTNIHQFWAQKSLTMLAPGRRKSYTVRFDRWRGLKLCARLTWNAIRFFLSYNALLKAYRAAYPETASKDFWKATYGMDGADQTSKTKAQQTPR